VQTSYKYNTGDVLGGTGKFHTRWNACCLEVVVEKSEFPLGKLFLHPVFYLFSSLNCSLCFSFLWVVPQILECPLFIIPYECRNVFIMKSTQWTENTLRDICLQALCMCNDPSACLVWLIMGCWGLGMDYCGWNLAVRTQLGLSLW